jgi:hypothetical protein
VSIKLAPVICLCLVCDVNRTPSKKDRFRQRWSERDEACFGTPIESILDQDFDFEKNLALFNKQVGFMLNCI